jgi:aspartate/methionine/tyrosine aminotransferase
MAKSTAYIRTLTNQKVHQLVDQLGAGANFVTAMEAVYAASGQLLTPELETNKLKLSSGVSSVKTFSTYLDIASESLKTHAHYRNYNAPQGDINARRSLALQESLKFDGAFTYGPESVCITDGATGAISSIFEYLKSLDSNSEVIIPVPSYYLFKECAKHYQLMYREVRFKLNSSPMTSMASIIRSISELTKAVVITQPTNPAGELYSDESIRELILIAKEKGIIVIFDEVFSDLMMTKVDRTSPDKIAHELGALDTVISVKAYSKNRNIPGLRIGYALSSNQDSIAFIAKCQEIRSFNAGASNFAEIICLDAFYSVFQQLNQDFERTLQVFVTNNVNMDYLNIDLLKTSSRAFVAYSEGVLETYKSNLKLVTAELKGIVGYSANTVAAFNTFVNIPSLDRVSQYDFCVNLFLEQGVKTQVGPYFGLTQTEWQDNYGFWLRISFSMSQSDLRSALQRFKLFTTEYLNEPQKYYSFGYTF